MKKEKLHQLNSATLKSLHQHPAPQSASGKPPTCHTLPADQTQHGERRLEAPEREGKAMLHQPGFLAALLQSWGILLLPSPGQLQP